MNAEKKPEDRRKYPRFHDIFFGNVDVGLEPVPPLFGDVARGSLIDLSACGMALLLNEVLPKRVMLKMKLLFPDGFLVESVVRIMRMVPCGSNGYLHGIEFLNPSPEAVQRVDLMAQDSLACTERIADRKAQICYENCSLFQICKRPQCMGRTPQPVEISLSTPEDEAWRNFRDTAKQRWAA